MKKSLLKLAALFIMMECACVLSSCGNDDDDIDSGKDKTSGSSLKYDEFEGVYYRDFSFTWTVSGSSTKYNARISQEKGISDAPYINYYFHYNYNGYDDETTYMGGFDIDIFYFWELEEGSSRGEMCGYSRADLNYWRMSFNDYGAIKSWSSSSSLYAGAVIPNSDFPSEYIGIKYGYGIDTAEYYYVSGSIKVVSVSDDEVMLQFNHFKVDSNETTSGKERYSEVEMNGTLVFFFGKNYIV